MIYERRQQAIVQILNLLVEDILELDSDKRQTV
jgi:hypothetical protein